MVATNFHRNLIGAHKSFLPNPKSFLGAGSLAPSVFFQVCFPTPLPIFRGVELQGLGQNLASGRLELRAFGREAPKNGAKGAVLENFISFE